MPERPRRSQRDQGYAADHQQCPRPAQPADALPENIFGEDRFQHIRNGRDRHRETELGDREQLQIGEEREGHRRHRGHYVAVAGKNGEGAAERARAEVMDLAMVAHADRLQNFADRRGRHDDSDHHPLHWPTPAPRACGFVVLGAVPPLTKATPAMMNAMPSHLLLLICSLSRSRPTIATRTYPIEVTGRM